MVEYNENEIDEIFFELINGKALIIPTDTQYGLLSIDKNLIYKIKRRKKNKKIIKFIKNPKMVNTQNNDFYKIAKKLWPGKITLIVGGESYRIPDSELIKKILERFECVYCSSANISGYEPILTKDDAIKQFSKNLDKLVFISSKNIGDNNASTIYDVDNKKIIREGIISIGDINECL